MIRLAVPDIGDEDLAAVAEVLRSGQLVQGEHVRRFEARVAREAGTAEAVALVNCTAALHLALLGLGVGPGDRVAVATYSWPATANAIELCGATPVFVDVEPETFNMAPARLAEALDADDRVRAVLPVHAFGGMADVRAIGALAAARGLPVLEDAACAIGAALDGRPAGAWGRAACFSFHPRKAVTTGEGGAVTTDDERLAWHVRALRNHGLDPSSPTPDFVMPGYNLRLTEFQAALGVTQLDKLSRIVAARRARAARYDALLADSPLRAPRALAPEAHVYQSYVVLLPPEAAPRRAEIIAELRARGVETTLGTYHMPLTTFYRGRYGYAAGDFPVTDDVAARALTLPLHARLSDDDQRRVVASVVALL